MNLVTTPEILSSIWTALNSAPKGLQNQETLWSSFANKGWADETRLEDGLYLADYRLGWSGLKPTIFAEILDLPWRGIFERPNSRFDSPMLVAALSAIDAGAVLILIERLGFAIDAEWLCSLLRPELKSASHLTSEGFDVLFHDKSQHRAPPVTLSAETNDWREFKRQVLRTSTGYRIKRAVDDEGVVGWMTVSAPKFRRRPEPIRTTCDKCGMTYLFGLPSEDKNHREFHRRTLSVLEPYQDRRYAKSLARNPLNAPWVDYKSPQWKRDLVYRRACAFKREMGYDFVQWAQDPNYDPDPIGFIFADNESRILGACVFPTTSLNLSMGYGLGLDLPCL